MPECHARKHGLDNPAEVVVKETEDGILIKRNGQNSSLMLVREREEEVEKTDLTPSRRFQRC